MANLNPMQLMMMLKNGNPQQVAQQIIQSNFSNNPQMQQLIQLGLKGDTQKLQQIATQVFCAQGKNFNNEFETFMKAVKNL